MIRSIILYLDYSAPEFVVVDKKKQKTKKKKKKEAYGNFGGQTKSIMVFLKVTYIHLLSIYLPSPLRVSTLEM